MTHIIAAAIKYKDKVYIGREHWRILEQIEQKIGMRPTIYLEGFMTNDHKFVGRVEAAEIAYSAGQITTRVSRLLSNMIYMPTLVDGVVKTVVE